MSKLAPFASTLALVALGAASSAQAACFFVYGGKNDLIYRSTLSPIDLSRPISDGMRGRFAGGHLTMIPDEAGCPDLLVAGQALQFSAPGTGTRAVVDASPLFRNAGARDSAVVTDGDAAAPITESAAEPRRRRDAAPRTR